MAERIFLESYMVFSLIMTGITYPICAGWAWGDGWLYRIGFRDFSGSGIVHTLGGVSGFWGILVLGPRIG
jgi:Amt family ammonium transporter